MRERDRYMNRQADRETDTQIGRETERGKQREREREIVRQDSPISFRSAGLAMWKCKRSGIASARKSKVTFPRRFRYLITKD